jgi:putative transposase
MEFERKKNRLGMDEYFGRKRFFVTTCCRGRQAIFRNVAIASRIVASLREQADRCDFGVHAYCVMPDHVHILLEGKSAASNLVRFVKAFKQATSYACRAHARGTLWEKSFYDHILRPRDSIGGVAAYIRMKPVRKGICNDPRKYLFSGSLSLPWSESQPAEMWQPPWRK